MIRAMNSCASGRREQLRCRTILAIDPIAHGHRHIKPGRIDKGGFRELHAELRVRGDRERTRMFGQHAVEVDRDTDRERRRGKCRRHGYSVLRMCRAWRRRRSAKTAPHCAQESLASCCVDHNPGRSGTMEAKGAGLGIRDQGSESVTFSVEQAKNAAARWESRWPRHGPDSRAHSCTGQSPGWRMMLPCPLRPTST